MWILVNMTKIKLKIVCENLLDSTIYFINYKVKSKVKWNN